MENKGWNLMNLLKKILISTEIVYHLMNKKKKINKLIEKKFMNLRI